MAPLDDAPDRTAIRRPAAEADPGRSHRNRMVVALLALAGFFVSFYLLAHALGWTGPLVCGAGGCSAVQASEYAWIGAVPVAGIGTVGYLAVLGIALLGLQPRWHRSPLVAAVLFGGA